ncbi:MAG TPA: efflux RND transporter periplasmic adaptor subunit [Thermoanaerobaculia bacterium]|jgi:macrolide-specific efflux system membrane fusion protein|nr:efflux RND transporter periplasmic adaptor subunit [Thermoanaerobaculia bacterium]
MKKLLFGGIFVSALIVAGVVWAQVAARRDEAALGGAQVARVTRRDVETVVKATGIIKPMIGAEVRVGSRASGVVQRLFVRVGDSVKAGQLLAQLDARDLQARRGEAAAALASADADLRYAEADLQRKRELAAAQVIATGDLDLAERAFAVARQQRARAQAALDAATTELGYARIVAPMAGIVASVSTQEGETVAASFAAPTFVTLLDLDRLEVRAYVDETDIGRIRLGQRARFTVDTYPGVDFPGRLTAIYPQAEIRDNVVDYVTVVRFATPSDRTLRPEMTTTVRVLLDRRAHVLTVPIRAVRRAAGRPFVVLAQGDRLARRPVTTGARDESYWEIVAGLREGDEVLVGEAGDEEKEPS